MFVCCVFQLHRVAKKVRAFVIAKIARKIKTVKAVASSSSSASAAAAGAPPKPVKGKAAALAATPEAIAKLDAELALAKVC